MNTSRSVSKPIGWQAAGKKAGGGAEGCINVDNPIFNMAVQDVLSPIQVVQVGICIPHAELNVAEGAQHPRLTGGIAQVQYPQFTGCLFGLFEGWAGVGGIRYKI